jgi:CarD family transcriptional regulator
MKASGTAAKARKDSAHRKAPAAKPAVKPVARAQAKSVPAEVKKAAKPVPARAAATAVATKSAPVVKKAAPVAAAKQTPPAAAVETPARPTAAGAGSAALVTEAAAQPPAKSSPTTDTAKQASAAKAAPASGAAKPPASKATDVRPGDAKPAATKAAHGKAHAPAAQPVAAPVSESAAAPGSAVAETAKAKPGQTPATPGQHPAALAEGTETAAQASASPVPAPATPAGAPAQPPPRSSADAARRPGAPGMHTGPITAPRIPAKAEVFHEGDHVVYPTHGVGKVERIATEEIAGHKLELIHITFEENRMTLRVPVAKARTAGLRKLATRKLFEEALNVLKGRARIKRTMWSRRAQEYEAKINSGDPLAIAEVVRDLHRNAGQPDQSFSERQIYEAAMERLAAELAALDKTDKATAATKLTDFLKTV